MTFLPDNRPSLQPGPRLLGALFAISAASIGFEILLTRYFAIASWSEYGYWVISIAMAGYSASGVVLSLFRDFFLRRAQWFFFWIPFLLPPLACLSFYWVTLNSFNPLEFQDPDLWRDQFENIAKYYGALFPVFFLCGLYISLSFLALTRERIPVVYAADLVGAGAGALLILFAMFFVQPFYLLTVLLPLFSLAAFLTLPWPKNWTGWAAIALVLFLSEGAAVRYNQARFCPYKMITPALSVDGARVVRRLYSPQGYYMLLDDFTERLDIDLSNNYASLNASGPPRAFGLYLDGNRIGAFPKGPRTDTGYTKASLDIFPYTLKPQNRVLLIGSRGGFRVGEALEHGVAELVALEPDPNLYSLLRGPLADNEKGWLDRPKVTLLRREPTSYLAGAKGGFDLIDLSSDFLGQSDANKYAFTQEAFQRYWSGLNPGGLISVPVSMRELTVYALKVLETAREALVGLGIQDPAAHLVLYRSAWNARLLIAKDPWTPSQLTALRNFCEKRSFDVSYYQGLGPRDWNIFNDLPPTVWNRDGDQVEAPQEVSDALRDDSLRLLSDKGGAFREGHFFDLHPSTHDRPFFYSVLRFSRLKDILRNISQIPREEIGYLINLAVLGQSLLWALLVLLLPWLKGGRAGVPFLPMLRTLLYFSCLGLGFLFIEILLIEKGTYFLGDRTDAFALVLSAMLVFSGMGSWLSGRYAQTPQKGLRPAALGVGLWLLLGLFLLDPVLGVCLPWTLAAKGAVLVFWAGLVSVPLGFFFPLGLSALPRESGLVPWGWALNGAFSVVATPLANLTAVTFGYHLLFWAALALYFLAFLSFPMGLVRLDPSKGQ